MIPRPRPAIHRLPRARHQRPIASAPAACKLSSALISSLSFSGEASPTSCVTDGELLSPPLYIGRDAAWKPPFEPDLPVLKAQWITRRAVNIVSGGRFLDFFA